MPYDGCQPVELAARLRAPGCLVLARVTSTLDIIHELAAEGAPAGTVVVADEQVAGRGRHGRPWSSPAGRGIWLGYLARPSHALEGGVMALRVGLALADTLAELGVAPRLKWPNDVVVEDRKVGGVLCEARWWGGRLSWIAVGIGLNVHGPLPDDLAGRAVALDAVVSGVTRVQVLERLVPRLHGLPDSPSLLEHERRAFAERDWLLGRLLREPVPGQATGIAADGALLVQTADGLRRVLGGSVVPA